MLCMGNLPLYCFTQIHLITALRVVGRCQYGSLDSLFRSFYVIVIGLGAVEAEGSDQLRVIIALRWRLPQVLSLTFPLYQSW